MIDRFKQRALSWSQLSLFNYSPEQWYDKYILGQKEPESEAMKFGKKIGEQLASDMKFLPKVLRYSIFEKELGGKIGDIPLIGFLDSFCPDTKNFYEYKTSSNAKKWTKKSAQEFGQILMYMFLIWLNYKIPPEKISATLFYIPVEENGSFELNLTKEPVQSFIVKHTSSEVLNFGVEIKNIVKQMEAFCKTKSRPK